MFSIFPPKRMKKKSPMLNMRRVTRRGKGREFTMPKIPRQRVSNIRGRGISLGSKYRAASGSLMTRVRPV